MSLLCLEQDNNTQHLSSCQCFPLKTSTKNIPLKSPSPHPDHFSHWCQTSCGGAEFWGHMVLSGLAVSRAEGRLGMREAAAGTACTCLGNFRARKSWLAWLQRRQEREQDASSTPSPPWLHLWLRQFFPLHSEIKVNPRSCSIPAQPL